MYEIHLGEINEFPQFVQKPTPPSAPTPMVTTVPTTSAPTATPQVQCSALFDSWATANPSLAKCLTSADVKPLMDICKAAIGDPVKQAAAAQTISNYVAAACARTAPPPPSIPPAQPPPDIGTPAEPPSDTSAPPKKSALMQMGPIVGIGLLAAVGLTMARKRAVRGRKRGRK